MKSLHKLTALLLVLLMVLGTLAGCGGTPKDPNSGGQQPGSSDPSQPSGGATPKILRVHLESDVSTMDAQLATDGYSLQTIATVVEGLYRLDGDGSPVLGVAESVNMSEDGLTYTFTLRDNAYWSNGDPVTADDFVFAWRRAVDPNTASEYAFIVETACIANAGAVSRGEKPVEELGVTALDSKTLEVKLDSVCAYFNSLLAFGTFLPVNEAFYNSCGDSYATSPETILCNGPFKVTGYEPAGTVINVVKNDKYYAADDIAIDGITFKIIKEAQQAVLAYQNGELDMVVLAGEQVELYEDDPAFQTVMQGYLWFVSPNLHVAGQENINIRPLTRKPLPTTC